MSIGAVLKEAKTAINIILSRIVLVIFCLFVVWQCTVIKNNLLYWLLTLPVLGLAIEAYLFYKKKRAFQEQPKSEEEEQKSKYKIQCNYKNKSLWQNKRIRVET